MTQPKRQPKNTVTLKELIARMSPEQKKRILKLRNLPRFGLPRRK